MHDKDSSITGAFLGCHDSGRCDSIVGSTVLVGRSYIAEALAACLGSRGRDCSLDCSPAAVWVLRLCMGGRDTSLGCIGQGGIRPTLDAPAVWLAARLGLEGCKHCKGSSGGIAWFGGSPIVQAHLAESSSSGVYKINVCGSGWSGRSLTVKEHIGWFEVRKPAAAFQ